MQKIHISRAVFMGLLACLLWPCNTQASEEKKFYKMGVNAQSEQNYSQAVEYFTKSLESEGESSECLANLGFSLQKMGEASLQEAYKTYLKSLKSEPDHEETLGYLGSLYILQGKLSKAYQVLDQLKKLESDEAETLQAKLDQIKAELTRKK